MAMIMTMIMRRRRKRQEVPTALTDRSTLCQGQYSKWTSHGSCGGDKADEHFMQDRERCLFVLQNQWWTTKTCVSQLGLPSMEQTQPG